MCVCHVISSGFRVCEKVASDSLTPIERVGSYLMITKWETFPFCISFESSTEKVLGRSTECQE